MNKCGLIAAVLVAAVAPSAADADRVIDDDSVDSGVSGYAPVLVRSVGVDGG